MAKTGPHKYRLNQLAQRRDELDEASEELTRDIDAEVLAAYQDGWLQREIAEELGGLSRRRVGAILSRAGVTVRDADREDDDPT